MSSRPVTPASPRNVRVKSPTPGSPMFGCEHVQLLLSQGQEVMNSSIAHYKMILRGIFDTNPIVPQTSTSKEGRPITTLTSNFLCLQCPTTVSEEDRLGHGNKKSHRFSNNHEGRKRKHDELFTDSIKDDPRYISSNTTLASCRADGLRGIYNAGATCYQNVVLQSFLHNPLLRNFYLSDGHQSNECNVPHCLSCAMDDMFQDFYALENTNGYTAANILSGFWISEKKAFENLVTTKEQDAHEFFQFLAEDLHERNGDGKKPEIGSEHSCNCIIHQTFYGKMQTTTTCQNCNSSSNTVQSFLDLSVGLDSLAQRRNKKAGQKIPNLSLTDCLDEEYIKSDKSRRYTSVKRLPNVLSIQLKRFEYKQGRHDHAASKVDVPVHFPLQLNMLPYTNRVRSRDSRENMELQRSCVYDLLSVVVHVGELETGHYTSYCRVGDQDISILKIQMSWSMSTLAGDVFEGDHVHPPRLTSPRGALGVTSPVAIKGTSPRGALGVTSPVAIKGLHL
ncbi:Peptidase C19, ubiquitin carboxyl-terminal hydrolase 2 [Cordyceps militaris CM01]|uniref:Peptidase C19, ubiquitin carboxyl-terminal hydrolase 2 n=1 Tax=Cordyceps militaris (strain CM01) TaxID=983644 RepID=G3J3R0_CORMM|nr:Peptidase C19, ubiquitin carboxyl-terminal hydrolase 2 [Cordyceps militaris CM01]EGX96535.1 Peptidase C19, ubiquitin carboxyl-terminal hydrolase 2 [Cordyceps militaris CM01]